MPLCTILVSVEESIVIHEWCFLSRSVGAGRLLYVAGKLKYLELLYNIIILNTYLRT